MIFRNAIGYTRAREISPPRQEIAATNASSHFGDLRGRSTCQAGNGPIDQTTAGLKVWRRATVKRSTGPLEKPSRRRAHRYRSYYARTILRIPFRRMFRAHGTILKKNIHYDKFSFRHLKIHIFFNYFLFLFISDVFLNIKFYLQIHELVKKKKKKN